MKLPSFNDVKQSGLYQWGVNRAQQDIARRRALTRTLKNPDTYSRIGKGLAATGAAVTIAVTSQAAPANASLLTDALFPSLQTVKDIKAMVTNTQEAKMPPVTLPDIAKNANGTLKTTPEQLILDLLAKNKRVGIGEMHNDPLIKETVIKMMPKLNKAGVKALYYEGFPNSLNGALDEYYNSGRPIDWSAIERNNQKTGRMLNGYDKIFRSTEAQKSGLPFTFEDSLENLGSAYKDELNKLVQTAKENGIRVFGLTSTETQLHAIAKILLDNREEMQRVFKESEKNGTEGLKEKLAEKVGTSFLTQYVAEANPSWKALIGEFERHYPGLKEGKSLVINGALHNTSMSGQAVPMDENYPSVAFIPDARGKHSKLEILKVTGSDDPKNPFSGDWEQPLGSPFEVRYPYRAPEIPQKSS